VKAQSTHIFRLSVQKPVYRDIEILSDKSLYDLAKAIVDAFNFNFDHAFGFYSKLTGNYFDSPIKYELFADMGESEARSVKRTRIAEAFPRVKSKLLFLFDYGDDWMFKVECIGQGERVPKAKYPRIVKSVGVAPIQYPDPDEEFDEEPEPKRERRAMATRTTSDGRVEWYEIKLGKNK
jgi:hypothetical protein